jgi:hypothetical protein
MVFVLVHQTDWAMIGDWNTKRLNDERLQGIVCGVHMDDSPETRCESNEGNVVAPDTLLRQPLDVAVDSDTFFKEFCDVRLECLIVAKLFNSRIAGRIGILDKVRGVGKGMEHAIAVSGIVNNIQAKVPNQVIDVGRNLHRGASSKNRSFNLLAGLHNLVNHGINLNCLEDG